MIFAILIVISFVDFITAQGVLTATQPRRVIIKMTVMLLLTVYLHIIDT